MEAGKKFRLVSKKGGLGRKLGGECSEGKSIGDEGPLFGPEARGNERLTKAGR